MKRKELTLTIKKEYSNLIECIKSNLIKEETEEASKLILESKDAMKRGLFTKKLLFKIAYWKSPRKAYFTELNSRKSIRKKFLELAIIQDDKKKLNLLDKLQGVGVPTASAILAIIDPEKYGVIDFRVWELLILYDYVDKNSNSKQLKTDDWLEYIKILRELANELNVTTKDIERTLFKYHKKITSKKKKNTKC